jgi:mannitol 2-dehydrogenase
MKHAHSAEQTLHPLRASTLSQLADTVLCPRYDRSRALPGPVHSGVGGFDRSHLAIYFDDLLARFESHRWGELGIGLLPGDKLIP